MGLINKNRKDSQGICFLGKVKFSDFIAEHLGNREGRLLEAETGELLGLHNGFWFYIMGQRQGDQGLAPGQYAAFYQDGVCLGSAIITETLGGADNLNVSATTLEIAQPFDNVLYKNYRRKISNSLRVSNSSKARISSGDPTPELKSSSGPSFKNDAASLTTPHLEDPNSTLLSSPAEVSMNPEGEPRTSKKSSSHGFLDWRLNLCKICSIGYHDS